MVIRAIRAIRTIQAITKNLLFFPIVSSWVPLSKALCRQLRVVLHHNFILHHGHHPPWLGICFRRSLWGVLHTPLRSAGRQSTKVNQPTPCGLFLLYPACCLIVRPYADSSKLSYTTTLLPFYVIVAHTKICIYCCSSLHNVQNFLSKITFFI